MVWKQVVNADAGDADHVGGNDWDKVMQLFSNIDVDDVTINSDWVFRDGKLGLRNPANTLSTIIKGGAITGSNKNISFPAVTADDIVAVLGLAQTFSFKTLDASCDVSLATGGGGGGGREAYSFFVYNDAGTYKARNGVTGVIDFTSATGDVGALLGSIFNSVSDTTPLYITVDKGDFNIKNWDGSLFDHHNFTIKGAGSGVTQFIVLNDVPTNGHNGVFKFGVSGSEFTNILLASNASKDDYAVLTNSTTDLTAGCHVVVGDDTSIPLTAAKQGEHNRVLKIVATGGSPAYRIILEKALRYNYTTAANTFIRKVDFLENIHLEGFTVTSNLVSPLTLDCSFMRFDFAYDAHVKDIQIKDWGVWEGGAYHTALVCNSVVNSDFSDITFEQSPERGFSYTQNPAGYAISCRAGSETVYYRNIRFKGLIRHCFTTTANGETAKNGHPTNIWIHNANSETTTEASFDTHGEGDGINFVNCSVHSSRSPDGTDTVEGSEDNDAFNSRAKNTRFINCSVYNCRGTGFSCDSGLTGIVFDGCRVENLSLGRTGIMCGASDAVIRNCYIKNTDSEGINVTGSNVLVTNNVVTNCPDNGIRVTGDYVTISNNIVENGLDDGLSLDGAINCIISNNIIRNNTGWGINFAAGTCTGEIITGNQFLSNGAGTITNGRQTGNIESHNIGYGTDGNSKAPDWTIYWDGSTIRARSNLTGFRVYSSTTNIISVLDSIISAITPTDTPTTIEIASGTFPATTGITPITKNHIKIKGAGHGLTTIELQSSITGNPIIFDIHGAVSGSSQNLTVNAVLHDKTLTMTSTSGFTQNDYILLRSTKDWFTGAQGKQGEIRQVRTVTSGTVLTLDGPIQDTYNTADTAQIIKVNLLKNFTLEGLSIKPVSSSYTQTGAMIDMMFCRDSNVNDVNVFNQNGSLTWAVLMRSCLNSKLNHVNAIMEEGFPLTGSHPYALRFSQANQDCTMESCTLRGPWRHLVASEGSTGSNCEGVCRGITISNCFVTGVKDSGFDTHQNGQNIKFIGCTVQGGEEHGFNVRSPGVTVQDCQVLDVDDYGIYLFDFATRARISGNFIRGAGYGIRLEPTDITDVMITDNNIVDCQSGAIYLADNNTDIVISNNYIDNCTVGNNNAGIYDTSTTSNPTTRINVTGNIITGCHRAIRMNADSTAWKIVNNELTGNNNPSTIVGTNKIFMNTGDVNVLDNNNRIQSGAITDINTTVAETDMLNYSVPGNTMGANGAVRFRITGYLLQNQVTATTWTFKVKFGTTTMYAQTTNTINQSATKLPFRIQGELSNKNATNAQSVSGTIMLNDTTAPTTGLGNTGDDEITLNANFDSETADTTKDTTSAQTLQVTVTHSVSDVNVKTVIKHTLIEVLPSN